MPRKSFSLNDYKVLERTHGMKIIGSVPRLVSKPTYWKCIICGREHYKSYNAIVHHSACVCRTEMTLKPSNYESLANQLGITWLHEYPPTNKIKVGWLSANGIRFSASYHELGYNAIPIRLRRYIYGE